MRTASRALAALALATLCPLLAVAADPADDALPGGPVEEVTDCVARNVPKKTSVQTLAMRARDRVGSERTIRALVHWKRFDDGFSRVRALFSEPADIAGAAFLMVEKDGPNDLFLYSPSLRKIRRITSQAMKGTIYGTDFSYEDFQRLQGVRVEQSVIRTPDTALDGRPVYVLEARPPQGSGSAYELARSWIDKRTCVPLKTELYEAGGKLRKVLTASPERIEKQGELWLPHELVMVDLRDETRTTLTVEKLEVGAAIPDRTFSLAQLERAAGR
jgi:outer membrane lipoprotein-sorting protein